MKKNMSSSMRAYNALIRAKKQFCEGKVNKGYVKDKASKYISAAVAKGKPKKDAQNTANRVLQAGCSISSNIRKPSQRKKSRKTS